MSLPILSTAKFSNAIRVYLRPEDCVVGISSVVKGSVVVVGGGVVVPSEFFFGISKNVKKFDFRIDF